MSQSQQQSGPFTYSSTPRPVQTLFQPIQPIPVIPQGSLYREAPSNIMFDKRVVRGPTVKGTAIVPAHRQSIIKTPVHPNKLYSPIMAVPNCKNLADCKNASQTSSSFTQPHQLRAGLLYKPQRTALYNNQDNSFEEKSQGTVSLQTDDFLEELTIDEVYERENACQTDELREETVNEDRMNALFAPAKHGIDASTSIEGIELFNYDIEVEPLLSALVGKALDQSLIEVNEEQELSELQKQRAKFAAERACVMAETAQLEREYARREAEKLRRFEQERGRLLDEQQEQEKRDAALADQKAMLDLHNKQETAKQLNWVCPFKSEVKQLFLPWLDQLIQGHVNELQDSQRAANELIMNCFD